MLRFADPTYKYEPLPVVHMEYPIKLKYWFKIINILYYIFLFFMLLFLKFYIKNFY
jgi:hypothetical protein